MWPYVTIPAGRRVGGDEGFGREQLQERWGDPADDAGGIQQETQGVGTHQGGKTGQSEVFFFYANVSVFDSG